VGGAADKRGGGFTLPKKPGAKSGHESCGELRRPDREKKRKNRDKSEVSAEEGLATHASTAERLT